MANHDRGLTRALAAAIEPYRSLLQSFVAGAIRADEFETEYLHAYLGADALGTSDAVFDVVDRFFAEVDAYVDDPELRAGTSDGIGPDELRDRAAELLRRAGYQA